MATKRIRYEIDFSFKGSPVEMKALLKEASFELYSESRDMIIYGIKGTTTTLTVSHKGAVDQITGKVPAEAYNQLVDLFRLGEDFPKKT